MLFASIITVIVFGGLFLSLNSGEFSELINSAKSEVFFEARGAVDAVTRDVREAVIWDIADSANSNPGPTHLKFRKVTGWNITSEALILGNSYVEYSYDPTAMRLTRTLLDAANNTVQVNGVNQVQYFFNITQSPFFTRDGSGNEVTMSSGDLLSSGRVIVSITARKQVTADKEVQAVIKSEVKIRNG